MATEDSHGQLGGSSPQTGQGPPFVPDVPTGELEDTYIIGDENSMPVFGDISTCIDVIEVCSCNSGSPECTPSTALPSVTVGDGTQQH